MLTLDQFIVLGYLVGVAAFGAWFVFYTRNSDEFMSAGQSIPGWAMGLSIFGSYISTLSFMGNPADAYRDNWNPLVFLLATPLAAMAATRFFVPFYRRTGEVSAYHHLEHRFGPWARTYGVACFVLMQIVRLGMITQLLATVVAPLFNWDVRWMIIFLGCIITIYPMLGGTEGIIWAGVVQSIVMMVGVVACVYFLIAGIPGGISEIISVGFQAKEFGPWGKFSLGPGSEALVANKSNFTFNLYVASFWVVLFKGLEEHMRNFAVDQSYIQRYISSKSEKDAQRSVRYGVWMYFPTACLFFFIGAALYAYANAHPDWLPDDPEHPGMKIGAKGVFPYFINNNLPIGLKGLVIAAIASAALDSNLNCMATLFLKDIYLRYLRPKASEKENMRILHVSTLVFGILSICFAFVALNYNDILKTWWTWGGLASGGIFGLFLLGVLCPKTSSRQAAIGVIVSVLVSVWMTLSLASVWPYFEATLTQVGFSESFLETLSMFRSPYDGLMIPFFGTILIFQIGGILGIISPRKIPVEEPKQGS